MSRFSRYVIVKGCICIKIRLEKFLIALALKIFLQILQGLILIRKYFKNTSGSNNTVTHFPNFQLK